MKTMQFEEEKLKSDFVYLPGEGKTITVAGENITFKAVSEDTKGSWTLMEFVVPPHFSGPPPHWHQKETEGFYVLSGTLTVQIEARTMSAPSGSFALIPPGVIHTFANHADEPVAFLSILSPGGFEEFVEELAAMMQRETTWPPTDMSQYKALNAKYGMFSPPSPSR